MLRCHKRPDGIHRQLIVQANLLHQRPCFLGNGIGLRAKQLCQLAGRPAKLLQAQVGADTLEGVRRTEGNFPVTPAQRLAKLVKGAVVQEFDDEFLTSAPLGSRLST